MHLQNYFHSIIVWPFALLEVAFHVSQGHYFVGKMACTQTLVDGSPRIQKNPLTHQRAQTPTISTTYEPAWYYGLEKVGLSRFSFEPINFVQSENTKTQQAALICLDSRFNTAVMSLGGMKVFRPPCPVQRVTAFMYSSMFPYPQ